MFVIPGTTNTGIEIIHTDVKVYRINIGSPSRKMKYITPIKPKSQVSASSNPVVRKGTRYRTINPKYVKQLGSKLFRDASIMAPNLVRSQNQYNCTNVSHDQGVDESDQPTSKIIVGRNGTMSPSLTTFVHP